MAVTLHQMEQLILHALTTRGSQIVFSLHPPHEIRILHAVTTRTRPKMFTLWEFQA